jgi:hypothetical protein
MRPAATDSCSVVDSARDTSEGVICRATEPPLNAVREDSAPRMLRDSKIATEQYAAFALLAITAPYNIVDVWDC